MRGNKENRKKTKSLFVTQKTKKSVLISHKYHQLKDKIRLHRGLHISGVVHHGDRISVEGEGKNPKRTPSGLDPKGSNPSRPSGRKETDLARTVLAEKQKGTVPFEGQSPKKNIGGRKGFNLQRKASRVWMALARVRTTYLARLYWLHIRIRYLHDKTYQKGGWYKTYSDKAYTQSIHKAAFTAFIVSFAIFSFAQSLFPYLFSLKPRPVIAGANSVTWTTQSHFENNGATGSNYTGATTRSQVKTAGNNDNVTLPDPQRQNHKVLAVAAPDGSHTVGLKNDGTVVAVGYNDYGQLNVGGWSNIISLAAGSNHTIGLKNDGTVVATGSNDNGQLNVGSWSGITAIASGMSHTIGLKNDGTVVAVGGNTYGECNVSSWSNITAIAADGPFTVGLRSNGNVVAVGINAQGQINVGSWSGITAIATGNNFTVGLQSNGNVVRTGSGPDVSSLNGLVTIAAGAGPNVTGLKNDGTVVAVGSNTSGQLNVGGWSNITEMISGNFLTLGLKNDGTVAATGRNFNGELNVSSWSNIRPVVVYPSPGTISGLKINTGAGVKAKWSTISWTGSILTDTAIKFRTRGSDDNSNWSAWSSYYTSSGSSITTSVSQWLEIEMILEGGGNTPTINDFTINYNTISAPTGPKQYRTDTSAEIAQAGYTNQSTANLKANVVDAIDNPSTLTPQIEMNTTGSFSGTPGTPGGVTYNASNINYAGSPISDTSIGSVSGLSAGNHYYWKVRYVDGSGRVSGWSSASNDFSVEQTPPTGSVTGYKTKTGTTISQINGKYYTASQDVKISASLADTGGAGLNGVQLSNDGNTWGSVSVANGADGLPNTADDVYTFSADTWYTSGITGNSLSADIPWQLSTNDAEKTIYMKVKDNAGNVSGTTATSGLTDFQNGTRGTNIGLGASNVFLLKPNGATASSASECISNYVSGGVCAASPWIAGLAGTAMQGKAVYNADVSGTKQWKTTNTSCVGPQCATGLDPNYPANYVLVSPQTYPSEPFTGYPAQIACKAIGGRLPNMQELLAIYAGKDSYGNNFQGSYWSATEDGSTYALWVIFVYGGVGYYDKNVDLYVRCVKDTSGGGNGGSGPAGIFTSPSTIDIGSGVAGLSLTWSDSTPSPSTVTMRVRAGNSTTVDGTWTSWSSISKDGSLSAYAGKRYFQYEATLLSSDQNVSSSLNSVAISSASSSQITLDTQAPNAVGAVNGYNQSGGTQLTSGNWYNYNTSGTRPYFSWTAPTDNGLSGIAGYNVYWGTSSSADPATAGSYQTGLNFTNNTTLTTGTSYYLRVKSKDNAGNFSSAATQFEYKYDGTNPTVSANAGVNLAPNSSFETNTTGWGGVYGMTGTRNSNNQTPFGSYSVTATNGGVYGGNWRNSVSGIKPSTSYITSGYFKSASTSCILLFVYDRSVGGQATSQVSITNTNGVWTRFSTAITTDANTTGTGYIDAPRCLSTGTESLEVDGVQLEEKAVLPATDYRNDGYLGPATSSWSSSALNGTAADTGGSGLSSAKVIIQRNSPDTYYWNQTLNSNQGGWQAGSYENTVTGSSSWNFGETAQQMLKQYAGFVNGTTYTITGKAYDTAGNSATATDTFVWDDGTTSAPSSTVSIPTDNCTPTPCSVYGPAGSVNIWPDYAEGTAADTQAGVSKVDFQIQKDGGASAYWNGSTWNNPSSTWNTATSFTGTGWRYTLLKTNLINGATYKVKTRTTDAVGNVQSTIPEKEFSYDDGAPDNSTFAVNSGDTYAKDRAVILKFTMNGDNDVRGSSYSSAGTTGIRIMDTLANVVTDPFTTEPWNTIFNPSDLSPPEVNYSIANAGDGDKKVWVQLRDRAGNISTTSKTDTVILDTTPATGTIAVDNKITNSSYETDMTGWSNGGTVVGSVSTDVPPKAGAKTAKAVHGSGSGYLSQDITPKMNNGDSVTLTAWVRGGSGNAWISLYDDGTNYYSNNIATSGTWQKLAATHPFTTGSSHWAVLWSDPGTTVYWDAVRLQVNPDDSADYKSEGYVKSSDRSVKLFMTASDATSGISEMQFANDVNGNDAADDAFGTQVSVIDGTIQDSGTWESFAASKAWYLTPSGGTKKIFIKLKDIAGNITTITPPPSSLIASTIYDSTAPGAVGTLASSTHPNQSNWYDNSDSRVVTTSWTAPSDTPAGIDGYSVKLDQTAGTTPDDFIDTTALTATSGSGIADFATPTADGIYYFHVKAIDKAGNLGTVSHYTVKVDTAIPTSNNIAVNGLDDTKIRVTWSPFADASSGLKEYRVYRSTVHGTPESYNTTDPDLTEPRPEPPTGPGYTILVATVNAQTNTYTFNENLPSGGDSGQWNHAQNPNKYTLDDKVFDSTPPQGGWYYYKIVADDNALNPTNTSAPSYGHSKTNQAPNPITNFTVNGGTSAITIGPADSKTVTLAWSTTDPDHNPPTVSDISYVRFVVKKPGGTVHVKTTVSCPGANCTAISNGYSISGLTYAFGANDAYGDYTINARTIDTVAASLDDDASSSTHIVNSSTVTVKLTPDKPTGVSASSDRSSRVDINTDVSQWTAPNSGAGVSSYKVYRRTDNPGGGDSAWKSGAAVIYSGPNKYYQDNSVVQDVTYYFRVSAIDQSTNEGLLSDVTSAKPPKAVTPNNVRLTDNSQTSSTPPNYKIFISWDEVTVAQVPNVVGYVIYRSTSGSGGVYSYFATIESSATNYYLDAGVDSTTTYAYKIYAYDSSYSPVDGLVHQGLGDSSGDSSPNELQPGTGDTTKPVISNVSFTYTATSATFSWTTNENADSRIDYGLSTALGLTFGYSTLVTGHTDVKVSGLSAGSQYYFAVKSSDGSGNMATDNNSGAYYIKPPMTDSTPPTNPATISVWDSNAKNQALASGTWYNYVSPRFEWSDGADVESDVLGYSVYFGTDSAGAPNSYQSKSTPLAENSFTANLTTTGTYYLRINTRNGVNGESSPVTLFTYNFDKNAPTSSVASPANSSRTNTASAISGTATDGIGSGVAGVQAAVKRNSNNYYLNGSNQFVDNGGTPIWLSAAGTGTWSLAAAGVTWSNGTYTIQTKAIDSVTLPSANVETPSAGAQFTFDNVQPTAVITYSDPDAKVKAGDQLVITATFSKDMIASLLPKIAISGVNTVSAIDMTRVDATHYTYTHTVSAGNGQATAALSTGTDLAGNLITTAPTSGANFTVDSGLSDFTDITAVFNPIKGAYKTGDIATITFNTAETLAGTPSVAIGGSTAAYQTNAGLNYTYTYTISSSDADGAKTITVTGTDVAGNTVSTTSAELFTVDNTAPTRPTVNAATSPTNASTQTITGTAEADSLVTITGGITAATQQLSSGATSYSKSVTLNQNTTNTLSATATDAAGNVSSAASASILHDNIAPDTTKVSLVAPDGSHLNTTTPTFVWSTANGADTGSSLDHYELWIDSQKNADGPADIPAVSSPTQKHITTSLGEGSHSWFVKIFDKAGNSSDKEAASLSVAIDLTKPTSTITSPTSHLYLNGTPTNFLSITGTAAKGSSADIANIYVSVTKKGTALDFVPVDTWTDPNWSYSWSISSGNDGDYFIISKATDAAGNTETYGSGMTVTVDKTPATITQNSIQVVDITSDVANINWDTNEVATSVVEYGLTDAYGSTASISDLDVNHSVRLENLTDGTLYHYRVKSTDRAGNETVSADGIFTTVLLDHIPPVITNIQSEAGSTTATITWNTDEVATSQIEYADNAGFSNTTTTTLDAKLNKDHRVTISSLTHNTTYYFKVKSKDGSAFQNERESGGTDSFTTTRVPGINTLSIKDEEDQEKGCVKITWITDSLTTSYVEYGTESLGNFNDVVGEEVLKDTDHAVYLCDLIAEREYHYRVKGKNAQNNETTGIEKTFVAPLSLALAPKIETQPTIVERGVSWIKLSWESDQSAKSLVQFKKSTDSEYTNYAGDPRVTTSQNGDNFVHAATVRGLSKDTEYNFAVKSVNTSDKMSLTSSVVNGRTLPLNINNVGKQTKSSSATISWDTGTSSTNAIVIYNVVGGSAKSTSADNPPKEGMKSSHAVELRDLSPGNYSFYVKSYDAEGNLAEAGDTNLYTFTITGFDEGALSSPQAGQIEEFDITATSAKITWTSTVPTTSWVDYGTSPGVYVWSAGNDTLTIDHVVTLTNLTPGQTYYYRVRGKDANGTEYRSREASFVAQARPNISSVSVSDITPFSAKVRVDVTKDVQASVSYGKDGQFGQKAGGSGLAKEHEIKLENLEDNATYTLYVDVQDAAGNTAKSETKTFKTPLDTEGPKITEVKIDLLPMGSDDETAQAIISWTTNKPSSTKIEYDEGVIGGKYGKSSIEDKSLNNSHTVIVKELNPSATYHFRIVSRDKRDNETKSQDYTFVTPSKEKSILQLILKSLEETFSWVKNLGGFFRGLVNRARK